MPSKTKTSKPFRFFPDTGDRVAYTTTDGATQETKTLDGVVVGFHYPSGDALVRFDGTAGEPSRIPARELTRPRVAP